MCIRIYLCFNTLRPRQNGRHFADDTFKHIFLNENVRISIKISLKFVPKGPIYDIPALVQIMAWRRPDDKPLSEPMMVRLPTHICVTRPQWVKGLWVLLGYARYFKIIIWHTFRELFCVSFSLMIRVFVMLNVLNITQIARLRCNYQWKLLLVANILRQTSLSYTSRPDYGNGGQKFPRVFPCKLCHAMEDGMHEMLTLLIQRL